MISIVIPTYKEPKYLDLCIESILCSQSWNNEIIVVVDGTYDCNKDVLDKYKGLIKPIIFDENYGQTKATNIGVYNAIHPRICIVNDDNVFPRDWDSSMINDLDYGILLTPNQIEPYNSMFKQFIKQDFGKTVEEFNLQEFQLKELTFRKNKVDDTGSTLPIFMYKVDFLRVGGWDESYPGAHVTDWDFMLKCRLSGMKMRRSYKCNFYHFVSIGTKSPEQIELSKQKENDGFEFFKYKWGSYPVHNPSNNEKSLQKQL